MKLKKLSKNNFSLSKSIKPDLKIKKIGVKKAQHEIMGFVLIILVVIIIGVIFLGFSLRNERTEKRTSAEIHNFLQASMYYTTNCAIDNIPDYENLEGLIKECYKDNSTKCLNDINVCDSLNSILNNVIVDNLQIGYKNKAYELDMYFKIKNSTIPQKNILNMQQGVFANCSAIIGSSYSIPYVTGMQMGNFWIELDVCKA